MAQIILTDTNLDTFVEQHIRDSSLYHSPAWLDLLARLYGYSVIPLISTNTSRHITGFLPLCFMQSPLTGRRLVSLPFSDHCPLLAMDECSANDLIDQAILLAQQQKVRYLELRTGNNEVLAKRTDWSKNIYMFVGCCHSLPILMLSGQICASPYSIKSRSHASWVYRFV